MPSNLLLGVNVDHVVTLRQARYRQMLESPNAEPSVLAAALLAEQAGAHSITIHLRADRRHIQDHDVTRMRAALQTRMNLEMAATDAMLAIARDVARGHGGDVTLGQSPLGGLKATLRLPN